MAAARAGDLDTVRLLLAHGADVEATERDRRQTALMWAVAQGHAAVAQVLIEHGADVLVMGDDWAGRFDEFRDVCEVVYLPRTPAISTTALIEKISGTS